MTIEGTASWPQGPVSLCSYVSAPERPQKFLHAKNFTVKENDLHAEERNLLTAAREATRRRQGVGSVESSRQTSGRRAISREQSDDCCGVVYSFYMAALVRCVWLPACWLLAHLPWLVDQM